MSVSVPIVMVKAAKIVDKNPLDLSFNNFFGEIPASIADCYYLNDLKPDHNKLIGHIPPQSSQLDRSYQDP